MCSYIDKCDINKIQIANKNFAELIIFIKEIEDKCAKMIFLKQRNEVAIANISSFERGKLETHPLHDVLVDRFARLGICPVHGDLVIPKRHFTRY